MGLAVAAGVVTWMLVLNHLSKHANPRRAEKYSPATRLDLLLVVAIGVSRALTLIVGAATFGQITSQTAGYLGILGAFLLTLSSLVCLTCVEDNPNAVKSIEMPGVIHKDGIYASVLHPIYGQGIIQCLAIPMVFASTWAFIPGVIGAAAYLIRASHEESLLRKSSNEYAQHANRTKYRFFWGAF